VSLALTQRVKDLEQRLGTLERTIVVMQNAMEDMGSEKKMQDEVTAKILAEDAKLETEPKTKKLCPKCNKAPGYFFHVRSCKG
jgi:hypothetical protein